METQPKIGKITIAPGVLETVVRLTTLAVSGVARLTTPPGMRRILGKNGVKVEVSEDSVYVTVYVVAEPNVNLLNVGRQIQAEVTRAIEDIIGMEVESVDVHIEDVISPAEPAQHR